MGSSRSRNAQSAGRWITAAGAEFPEAHSEGYHKAPALDVHEAPFAMKLAYERGKGHATGIVSDTSDADIGPVHDQRSDEVGSVVKQGAASFCSFTFSFDLFPDPAQL
jgi:hypothetical protein